MSAQHGIEISLRIGQHVRHRDYKGRRVTGVVRGLSVDTDRTVQVDIALDAPIVIPARGADDREVSIWHQHVPAHELTPFDDRDELVAELLAAVQDLLAGWKYIRSFHGDLYGVGWDRAQGKAEAAIAKATGAAS